MCFVFVNTNLINHEICFAFSWKAHNRVSLRLFNMNLATKSDIKNEHHFHWAQTI